MAEEQEPAYSGDLSDLYNRYKYATTLEDITEAYGFLSTLEDTGIIENLEEKLVKLIEERYLEYEEYAINGIVDIEEYEPISLERWAEVIADHLKDFKSDKGISLLINGTEGIPPHVFFGYRIKPLTSIDNEHVVPLIKKKLEEGINLELIIILGKLCGKEALIEYDYKKILESLIETLKPENIHHIANLEERHFYDGDNILEGTYTDWQLKVAAAELLGEIGDKRDIKRAVDPLIKLLQTLDSDVEETLDTICTLIEKIADDQTVERLIKLLKIDETYYRNLAVGMLGRIGNKNAIEPLHKTLERETTESMKTKVLFALAELGDKSIIQSLIQLLEKETQQFFSLIRIYEIAEIVDALANLQAREAIQPIENFLEDIEHEKYRTYKESFSQITYKTHSELLVRIRKSLATLKAEKTKNQNKG